MNQTEQFTVPPSVRATAARRFANEPRPFLKWAGSKQALLPHLIDVIPPRFGTYFEPFLGAAALFFLLDPPKAVLSDICVPLIDTFRSVQEDAQSVLRHLNGLRPSRSRYYETRARKSCGRFKRAADFIYVNKTCWNGLYRVNSLGEFNVPYGWPKTGHIVDSSNLLACGSTLKRAELLVRDFANVEGQAKAGDFVYFDPPYVTGHNNNGFRDWNETLFSWADQQRLASLASRLATRGVHVLVSNADHAEISRLYRGFRVRRFTRSSTLASSAEMRRSVSEVLFFTQ